MFACIHTYVYAQTYIHIYKNATKQKKTINIRKKTKNKNRKNKLKKKKKTKQEKNKIYIKKNQLPTVAPELVTLAVALHMCYRALTLSLTTVDSWMTGVICEVVTPQRQNQGRFSPLAKLFIITISGAAGS